LTRTRIFCSELEDAVRAHKVDVNIRMLGEMRAEAKGAWIDVHHVATTAEKHLSNDVRMSAETEPGSNVYILNG